MTGYQEVLTDPSYKGQIVAMTYPLLGNYGVNRDDRESGKPPIEGFVVRELTRIPSNYRSQGLLDDFLRNAGVLDIEGSDARAGSASPRAPRHERGAIVRPSGRCFAGAQGADAARHCRPRSRPRSDAYAYRKRRPQNGSAIWAAGPAYDAADHARWRRSRSGGAQPQPRSSDSAARRCFACRRRCLLVAAPSAGRQVARLWPANHSSFARLELSRIHKVYAFPARTIATTAAKCTFLRRAAGPT